jgi:hypothetical protein
VPPTLGASQTAWLAIAGVGKQQNSISQPALAAPRACSASPPHIDLVVATCTMHAAAHAHTTTRVTCVVAGRVGVGEGRLGQVADALAHRRTLVVRQRRLVRQRAGAVGIPRAERPAAIVGTVFYMCSGKAACFLMLMI